MKLSTKVAAILWIGLGFYCVLWRLPIGGQKGYKLTELITLLLLTSVFVLLPAASLLLGRAFGWWMMMILSAFVIAQFPVRLLVGAFHVGAMVIGTTICCVLVLALLLLDRPSRWHTAQIGL